MTFTQQVDLGGLIPKAVVNSGAVGQLMYLSTMRKLFDKSREVDGATRARNVDMITGHADEYSSEEERLLAEGEKRFVDFKEMKAKAVKMKSPLVRAEVAFQSGDRHVWGYAKTTVRASPAEVRAPHKSCESRALRCPNPCMLRPLTALPAQVLAFSWDAMRRSAQRKDDLEKSVEERVNGHSQLVYNHKKSPTIVADRDFLGRMIWRKEDDGFVLVTSPEKSEARPLLSAHSNIGRALSGVLPASSKSHEKSVVRGKFPSAMRIKRKNDTETSVEYVIRPDFGGSYGFVYLMNSYLNRNLERVTQIQEYFQALRGVEELDADDGRAVGEAMCIKSKAEKNPEKGESKQRARVLALFKQYKGLEEIAEKYEFFQPMMTGVVENKLWMSGDVKSKLCSVSSKEGETIGRGLAMAMASNLTAEAGVDEWIRRYRSLGELDREEAWFRPMLNTLAKRLLGDVSWGLKMRVAMGAGLSILDMATDIFVIARYVGTVETRGYGWLLLGMVVASMVLQLCVVLMQNKGKPRVLAKEMLIVMTGLKPAIDAGRVCAGQEMEEHHAFDAKSELMMTKGVEMISESIPGTLLQMYVLVKVRNASRATVGSVVVSAMTTGFSSASISFDFDVDPAARKHTSAFYGYVPDGGSRTVIFGCMILNSALLLLLRSLSAAMLMVVSKRYFVAYMAGDMALYLLLKVARGDFHYWMPIDGAFGLFASLMLRVCVKTIVDFTGVIHFRHPVEVGGLYWTVNMFFALLGSFGCVWFGGGGRTEWTLVGAASCAWVLMFGLFLLLMKKEYRSTFWSTRTGKEWAMDFFLLGEDDEAKQNVFGCNKKQWWAIREDVKEWVQENWWKWEEEKPLWKTEAWLAKVPSEFVPVEAKDGAKAARDRARRRSSFGGVGVAKEEEGRGRVHADS